MKRQFCLLACAAIAGSAVLGPRRCRADLLLDTWTCRQQQEQDRETVFVPRTTQPPTIDGRLDEPVWQTAWQTDHFTWGGGRAATNATVLLAVHDADNLYLAVRCATPDPTQLKTTYPHGEEDGRAWGDDCVDFKISPDNERTTYQFIVTAAGAYYDAKNADVTYNPVWQRATRIGADEYVIEMALPLAAIGLGEFRPGTPLLLNFGRADRSPGAGQLTVLAEPYLDFTHAPLFVLGTAAEYEALMAGGAFLREVDITVYMDRDQYPSSQRLATGRVRLESGTSGTRLSGTPALLLAVLRESKVVRRQRIEPITSPVVDFDLLLAGLRPGTYVLETRVADGAEILDAVNRREFVIERSRPERSGRIPITVPPAPANLTAWPITFGVPFPEGALESPEQVRLLDAKDAEVAIQVEVTGRWSKKGSIRWLLIDAVLPASDREHALTLVYGPRVQRAPSVSFLEVTEDETQVTVTTGPMRFTVPKHNTPGLAQLWLDDNGDGEFDAREAMLRPGPDAGPYLVDHKGTRYSGLADPEAEVVIESSGPLKACVRVSGWHVAESGEKLGKFILRYYAYAGLPYVRLYHTFIITASSNEAALGREEGQTEEVRYRDIAYSLPFSSSTYFFGTPKVNTGVLRGREASAYLLQRDDLCSKMFQNGVFMDEGEKAEGWMTVGGGRSWLTVAVKDFWQNFPKEFQVLPDRAIVHFWPAHTEEPVRTGANLSIQNVYQQWSAHEGELDFKIPGEVLDYIKQDSEQHNWPHAKVIDAMGLAKTHELLLYFHRPNWEDARARSVSRVFQANPTATCAPEWICRSGVFGNLLAAAPERYPQVEKAIDETIGNIFRHQEMDRDYGMFNFGDSHHNWQWQERRWNLHRIWRNTHHGWTRWPWLMYARSGRKDLFDWGDRNARHVADVDHCHYAPEEYRDLPYPRQKIVGGICDYKGFSHWAAGGRLCYNSAADAMLHHYYLTGDMRSLTAALAHGRALIENNRALAHREGSGRATSASALYFYTWDNDYLDFIERTVDRLLGTQREDGSFPQWEDFAPYLQRYVDLTNSRRGMQAMASWADWICDSREPQQRYHGKLGVLAHAYLYTGDAKYLRTAAFRAHEFVDNLYLGEDPRYYGMFIVGHTNLDQSYFLQWIGYYLAALRHYGREPEQDVPDRTWIRTHDRGTHFAEDARTAWIGTHNEAPEAPFLWQARLQQTRKEPFELRLELRGYKLQRFMAELRAVDGRNTVRAFAAIPQHLSAISMNLSIPADEAFQYELRVYADNNFSIRVPISYGQDRLKEVYPIFGGGTMVGDGFRYYFNLPGAAERFMLRYRGRAWPLKMRLFDPKGNEVGQDVWIGSNALAQPDRELSALVHRQSEGWSFSLHGYGQAGLMGMDITPETASVPLYFSLGRNKLFSPAE